MWRAATKCVSAPSLHTLSLGAAMRPPSAVRYALSSPLSLRASPWGADALNTPVRRISSHIMLLPPSRLTGSFETDTGSEFNYDESSDHDWRPRSDHISATWQSDAIGEITALLRSELEPGVSSSPLQDTGEYPQATDIEVDQGSDGKHACNSATSLLGERNENLISLDPTSGIRILSSRNSLGHPILNFPLGTSTTSYYSPQTTFASDSIDSIDLSALQSSAENTTQEVSEPQSSSESSSPVYAATRIRRPPRKPAQQKVESPPKLPVQSDPMLAESQSRMVAAWESSPFSREGLGSQLFHRFVCAVLASERGGTKEFHKLYSHLLRQENYSHKDIEKFISTTMASMPNEHKEAMLLNEVISTHAMMEDMVGTNQYLDEMIESAGSIDISCLGNVFRMCSRTAALEIASKAYFLYVDRSPVVEPGEIAAMHESIVPVVARATLKSHGISVLMMQSMKENGVIQGDFLLHLVNELPAIMDQYPEYAEDLMDVIIEEVNNLHDVKMITHVFGVFFDTDNMEQSRNCVLSIAENHMRHDALSKTSSMGKRTSAARTQRKKAKKKWNLQGFLPIELPYIEWSFDEMSPTSEDEVQTLMYLLEYFSQSATYSFAGDDPLEMPTPDTVLGLIRIIASQNPPNWGDFLLHAGRTILKYNAPITEEEEYYYFGFYKQMMLLSPENILELYKEVSFKMPLTNDDKVEVAFCAARGGLECFKSVVNAMKLTDKCGPTPATRRLRGPDPYSDLEETDEDEDELVEDEAEKEKERADFLAKLEKDLMEGLVEQNEETPEDFERYDSGSDEWNSVSRRLQRYARDKLQEEEFRDEEEEEEEGNTSEMSDYDEDDDRFLEEMIPLSKEELYAAVWTMFDWKSLVPKDIEVLSHIVQELEKSKQYQASTALLAKYLGRCRLMGSQEGALFFLSVLKSRGALETEDNLHDREVSDLRSYLSSYHQYMTRIVN